MIAIAWNYADLTVNLGAEKRFSVDYRMERGRTNSLVKIQDESLSIINNASSVSILRFRMIPIRISREDTKGERSFVKF